jgi:hypothetical protein
MATYLTAARMTDGKIQQFRVHDVESPETAREFVHTQVPRAKVIVALVPGSKGTLMPQPGTEAA